jgi:Rho-binding antiterminator
MSTKYQPINCDFHELLLAKATLKEVCEIKYILKDEKLILNSIIVDVFTKKGEEFMVLKSGETIRLDHIISVNDSVIPEFSCTFK